MSHTPTMNRFLYFAVLPVLTVIIVGQASFMPIAITLLWTAALLLLAFRIRRHQVAAIATFWQTAFALTGVLLIYLQFGRFWGVEPGVAFMTSCLFAKCLESKSPRDLIVVFNFGLFVTASLFLHSQAMWLAALVFVGLVFGFIGLFRIQTADFVASGMVAQSLKQDAKHVLKSVSIAIPFFVLLFMFFPRLPPVWSLPVPENKAVTGISDRMSPGDIAQLSQSSALAFRIIGDMQQLPKRNGLYWRAMVLDDYDGTTWTSHPINQKLQFIPQRQYTGFEYQYLAAQAGQKWVMSLEHSVPMQADYAVFHDGRIEPVQIKQQTQPIRLFWLLKPELLQQPVSSQPSAPPQLSVLEQRLNTAFIAQNDPKAQALAQTLWRQSAQNPKRYMQLLLNWYQRNGFVYTLAPGVLTQNRIDQFLFERRRGFCEHYASSFVMLMRYVGIPARVVVGYQGGQLAPDAKSWEVRQLDAHAWSEVWLDGAWQRVDPTAIIAPQRIDDGMQNYAGNNTAVWGDAPAWQKQSYAWLKTARVWSDYASYQWQSKVVGYDVDQQKNWLHKLGLSSSYSGVVIIILGFVSLGLAFGLYVVGQRYYAVPPFERALQHFNRQLPAQLRRQQGQTIQAWMQQLEQIAPQTCFKQAADLYALVHYADQADAGQLQQFKQLLKDCANAIKSHV